MYFVYVLKSLFDNSFYIGCTDDQKRRLNEHNAGRSRYTKTKRPWTLAYIEKFETLSSARHREKQIKSWKKRSAIEKLITRAPFV